MTGGTFWGHRACSCLLVPPHPYPSMNVAALSCEYIRQAETQPLSRARCWGVRQPWMHFYSWGTQQREKQLAQGEQVLLLHWGWNADVGSVNGASLATILTDSLCSLLTRVLRKHDLELMCSGRNRLGDFRLLLPLSLSPLFADGGELLKGWEHAVVRREFSAPPSKPGPWPTESTWRLFLRFLRDDIVICTWNCIIHRMTLWDGISAK